MSAGPLVVVGDALLDRDVLGRVDRLCPEAPVPVLVEEATRDRPGGAGLAAVLAATADGDGPAPPWPEVVLIAAFGADEAGERLRGLLAEAGVRLIELSLCGATPEKIRMRAGEHLLLRVDRGEAAGRLGPVPAEAIAALRSAAAILVSDYGRGVPAHPQLTAALAARARHVPLVWDPHPKGHPPVPGARLVTPNRAEAAGFLAAVGGASDPTGAGANGHGNGHRPAPRVTSLDAADDAEAGHDPAELRHDAADAGLDAAEVADDAAASAGNDALRLRRRWSAAAVVVTLAERGAVVAEGARPALLVPAAFAARGDPCGAGDRFASAAIAALAAGAGTVDAVRSAVTAATAYVAAGGAPALYADRTDLSILARSV